MAKPIFDWTKKLHMYSGLLTFTAFIVWGVTGIHAIFLPSPDNWRQPDPTEIRRVAWEVPPNLDDKELSLQAVAASGLQSVGVPVLRKRDENQNLTFAVFGPSGRRDLTVLEEEKQIEIAVRQNNVVGFLSSMHAGSSRRGPPELSSRIWGVYNEFSNWAFCFMTLTGIYLWLATRPKLGWAWMTFGAATVVFIALWFATR